MNKETTTHIVTISCFLVLFLVPADLRACDTWVALPDATASGAAILAKNSDRPFFDCQPLFFHPRRSWPSGSTIDTGRLTIPQAAATFATMGSSPYWCWGYEEGINEHGVAIGNEGIWTRPLSAALKEHQAGRGPEHGLTGMDLVRLGLERGKTAREALDVIAGLTETFGQFGSGLPTAGIEGAYDNSYIIADQSEAWILETAGTRWAARKISRGVASISNTTSIGTEWDRASSDLEKNAVSRGWWPGKDGGAFHFSMAYCENAPAIAERNERACIRAARSLHLLEEKKGAIDARWMMRIARDRKSSPGIDLDQTASSCVAVLPPKGTASLPVFWWCPAVPSRSCYIPFFIHGSGLPEIVSAAGTRGRKIVPPSRAEPDSFSERSYWWLFRDLFSKVAAGPGERATSVRAAFDALEKEFAAGLPALIEKAVLLRSEGRASEAAGILDAYTASCLERTLATVRELRSEFEESVAVEVPEEMAPFLGRYLATVKKESITVLFRNGRLAVEMPNKMVLDLAGPDKNGRRPFVLTDQAAVSFVRDKSGAVTEMKLHQGGLAFELIREGVVLPPEIDVNKARKYCGEYRSGKYGVILKVFIQNNRLAIDWPDRMIFELRPPDGKGIRAFRLGNTSSVKFVETAEGVPEAMQYLRDGSVDDTMKRVVK